MENIKLEPVDNFPDTKTVLFENLQAACENDRSYGDFGSEEHISKTENSFKAPAQDGIYQCDECPKLFQAVELYEIHRYIHYPVGDCPHCKRSYKSVKPFSDHIKDHIKNHIKCEYCPKIFFMKKCYIGHIAQHKKKDRIFVCDYCKKNFPTRKQLINHERVHTNERPYKCDQCDKTFKQNGSLKTHKNTHMEEKMFTCHACQGTFATTSSLKRHEKRIHATGRTMVCKLCEEEFLNLDSFFQHRMEKHPDSTRYFRICPICNEEFISKHRYLSHRKMHKEKGELEEIKILAEAIKDEVEDKEAKVGGGKTQKCVLCGVVVDSNQYYSHQNEHLEMTISEVMECERRLKFHCKKCDAILSTKQNAVRHMDLHLEKTYFCPTEGCIRKKPMTYMSYSKHRYNNHQNVKCRNCKTTFTGYLGFKRHRRMNPCKANPCKSNTPRKKRRVYICKWCKSTFTNLQFLLLHYNTHKRINVYNCHSCNKKFPRFNNFRKHMSVVHSEHIDATNTAAYRVESDQIVAAKEVPKNKFYCGICKETFRSRKTFEEHENVHFKSKFQCKNCKKCFIRQTNYWYHVKNKLCASWLAEAMLTEIKDFTCTVCKRELSNLRNFARHMTNVHGEGDYHCKHCVAKFNSLEKFRTHLVAKHPTEKKYFCTICEAAGFVTFREFIAHKRVHKRRHHIKQVLCKVTKENLEKCSKKVDIKQELQSDEEGEVLDVPENVAVGESGDIQEW